MSAGARFRLRLPILQRSIARPVTSVAAAQHYDRAPFADVSPNASVRHASDARDDA